MLKFPVEFAGRRTAIFGISGSGKSNTATVLIEAMLKAGEQIVLIDPKGEGWGLLSKADGRPSNLPLIVFGEPNGHIETLAESHGPRLADFVVETGQSVVLSLLGFESDQSERRFVATFLRQLYRRKSRQPNPTRTLVVLEEAHLFVPEQVRGDAAELAGAVQRIVRQGRSFGIGTLIVDQRPQDVSKRAITQCDTLICHQLVHKTDRDALREWVRGYDTDGQGEMFLESLASLKPGEAWIWSPAWLKVFERQQMPRRATFDSGAAPDGSAAARSVTRAPVDLEALRSHMAEILENAKANDPAELRRKIATLERQHATATPVVDQQAIERAVKQALTVAREAFGEEINGIVRDARHKMQKVVDAAQEAMIALAPRLTSAGLESLRKVYNGARLKIDAGHVQSTVEVSPKKRESPVPALAEHGQDAMNRLTSRTLGKCHRAILRVLWQHQDGCPAGKLTLLAGYAYTSTVRNALSDLRTSGLIDGGNQEVMRITEAGRALGPFDHLPTGQQLVEYWLRHPAFGQCARLILSVLARAYPHALTADEICKDTGYAYNSTFRNALSELRTAGVIEGKNTGEMKASDTIMTSQ